MSTASAIALSVPFDLATVSGGGRRPSTVSTGDDMLLTANRLYRARLRGATDPATD